MHEDERCEREETIEEKVKRLEKELEVREGQLVTATCVILKAEQDYEDNPDVMKVCRVFKKGLKLAKEVLQSDHKLADGVPFDEKLNGKELDKEIAKRKEAKEKKET